MALGAGLFLIGALWAGGVRLPLGRLPGDVVVRRGAGTFYFPVVTCLLLSVLFTVVSWLLRR
jgi:hypothetical protein